MLCRGRVRNADRAIAEPEPISGEGRSRLCGIVENGWIRFRDTSFAPRKRKRAAEKPPFVAMIVAQTCSVPALAAAKRSAILAQFTVFHHALR